MPKLLQNVVTMATYISTPLVQSRSGISMLSGSVWLLCILLRYAGEWQISWQQRWNSAPKGPTGQRDLRLSIGTKLLNGTGVDGRECPEGVLVRYRVRFDARKVCSESLGCRENQARISPERIRAHQTLHPGLAESVSLPEGSPHELLGFHVHLAFGFTCLYEDSCRRRDRPGYCKLCVGESVRLGARQSFPLDSFFNLCPPDVRLFGASRRISRPSLRQNSSHQTWYPEQILEATGLLDKPKQRGVSWGEDRHQHRTEKDWPDGSIGYDKTLVR